MKEKLKKVGEKFGVFTFVIFQFLCTFATEKLRV